MQSPLLENLWSFFDTESAPLTTIVAIIGVLFAMWNLKKISQDSHDRSRPYIALEPRPGIQLYGAIDLVVTNYGQSPAKNVVIKPQEPIEQREQDYILPHLNRFFGRCIHMAPNASFRIMWRSVYKDSINGAPESTKLKVTYEGHTRNLLGFTHKYSEVIIVDTSFVDAAPAPSEGAKNDYNGDEQIKVLKNIDLALRALNQHTANHY